MLYCKYYTFNNSINLTVNLKLTVGLTKPAPKLNLTLAPLNINVTNLLIEYNQYKIIYAEDNYIFNCKLLLNKSTNTNYLLIHKFDNIQINTLVKTYALKTYNLTKNFNTLSINYIFLVIINFIFKKSFNKLDFNLIIKKNINKNYIYQNNIIINESECLKQVKSLFNYVK